MLGKWSGMNLQAVANHVQPNAMRNLSEDHGKDVTPEEKGAGFPFGSGFVRQILTIWGG
jgi:hypothetical protein